MKVFPGRAGMEAPFRSGGEEASHRKRAPAALNDCEEWSMDAGSRVAGQRRPEPVGHRRRLDMFWLCSSRRRIVLILLLLCRSGAMAQPASPTSEWTASWASAQQRVCGPDGLSARSFEGATLRQTIHLSIGGGQVRLQLSNLFGRQPLVVAAVRVARAQPGDPGGIEPGSSVDAFFNGRRGVTVPPGGQVMSDPIPLSVAPLSSLAVSLWIEKAPQCVTSHPGARATSFLLAGDHTLDTALAGSESMPHWYFLSAVEVEGRSNGAVVAFGDSITDGHGSTTDGNDRWTDVLAARLVPLHIAVLNLGIGGNRVLAAGIGPSGVSRFERDALHQAGVRAVILLEGVNDLGGLDRLSVHSPKDHRELVRRLEAAMTRMVKEAHRKGVRVLGGTMMPYAGSTYYHPGSADEADRQALNAWIRSSGVFDGVIDFDKMVRDPAEPDRLAPAMGSSDHLHPGPDGYRVMGDGVPLGLLGCVRP